jgi:3-ketosteroid 9alpha-monooxygenase subunit B
MNTEVPHGSRSVLLTVAQVIAETSDAHSLVFDIPADAASKFAYRPGQFLTLRVPSAQTGAVARCYSLASSPDTDPRPKVTVKRTDGGYGSNWLCDNVKAGDTLEVLPPSGVFTPKRLDDDLLLFAAGSGITPVISILKSALAAGSGQVALFYANRDAESIIFATELAELGAKYAGRLTNTLWLQSERGLPSAADLAKFATAHASHTTFLCGPGPFMDLVHTALRDIAMPHSQVHTEVFNSLAGDPFTDHAPAQVTAADAATAATAEVELDGDLHELSWPRNQSLVDIMLAKGIDVPYSCQEGECGSCMCTVTEGKVDMVNNDILDPEDIASGYILGCQARPVTGHVRITFQRQGRRRIPGLNERERRQQRHPPLPERITARQLKQQVARPVQKPRANNVFRRHIHQIPVVHPAPAHRPQIQLHQPRALRAVVGLGPGRPREPAVEDDQRGQPVLMNRAVQ